MNLYKVSLIVPVYNAEKYIARCIQSIANQTYNNFELIIVDDGSVDKSQIIYNKNCKLNSNINSIIIKEDNLGQNGARYAGCKVASGEYITFVDADDWVEPDFVKSLVESLDDADISMQGSYINNDEGCITDIKCNNVAEGIYSGYKMKELIKDFLCVDRDGPFDFGILPYLWNKLFRREIILPVLKNVDKRITDGEDVAVFTACMLKANKVVVTNDTKYHYVIYPHSMSHKKHDNYMNATYLYQQLYKDAYASDYKDVLLPQINQYMRMMIQKEDPYQYLTLNKFWFPYSDVEKGSDIILYGAGNMGKAFYMENRISNYCNIVAWIDKNPSIYNYKGEKIKQMKIDSISQYKYDKILVAIANTDIQQAVKSDLISNNADPGKILLCQEYEG